MKKPKKSEINLLIMLCGVLLAVASYFFIFTSFNEKKAGLEGENASLQAEVDELQKLVDNKQFYIDETTRMNDEMTATLAKYPSDIRTEDKVMYTVNLESMYSIWVNSLAVSGTEMMQVAAPEAAPTEEEPANDAVETDETAQDAVVATGGMRDTVFLYNSPFTVSFKATYRSIKDIISAMFEADERMSISTLSLAYDGETGCLSGTMTANMYTMSGTGNEYEELNVPGVSTGTADFFQSGTVLDLNVNKVAADDTSDDAATEDEDASDDDKEDDDEDDEEEKSDDKAKSED